MTFQNIWPLAFLVFIPVIVFFYILRQRAKDREFSSTLLWREVYRNIQASTPFEKLRQNILMYLQIILLMLLIAALMAPVIRNAGAAARNVVIVIDNSASMGFAYDDADSRLEEAKDRAENLVNSLDERDVVTLVSCGGEACVVYQGTDKASALARIAAIPQTNEEGSLDNAGTLVTPLIAGMDSAVAYCYTDTAFDAALLVSGNGDAGYVTESVYSEGDNCAVNYVNYTLNYVNENAEAEALCSITNYTDSDRTLDVTLYVDDRAVDIQTAELSANASEIIYFDKTELTGAEKTLTARIDDDDAFAADNSQSVAVSDVSGKSVVLVSSGNVFLEKALALGDNTTVYKTDSTDTLTAQEGYDLYVFDGSVDISGMTMEECGIQEGSAILFMGVDEVFEELGGYIVQKEDAENVYLSFTESDISDYVEGYTFGVTFSHTYELPAGAGTCVSAGDDVAGFVGESAGVTVAVLGFDIHDTDLALRTEFPIFMSQLEERLLGSAGSDAEVYTFPSAAESQVVPAVSESEYASDKAVGMGDRSLRNILLAAVILLLVVEWIVYIIQSNARKKGADLAVRCVLLLMVVLAMLGVGITISGKNSQTIFLVDVSDSMSANEEAVAEYISEVAADKPDDASYAVVAFGGNTAVEQFMTDAAGDAGFTAEVVKSATNLENAVITATAMFDEDASKRLILITDGEENSGSVNKAALSLKNSDVSLFAIQMDSTIGSGKEVYIEDVELPSVIHAGDAYNVKVTVMSNVETDAELTLYDGQNVKAEREVHVTKGENLFLFPDTGTEGTIAGYRAVIEPDEDTISVNNTYVTYAEIDARPRMLLVLGSSDDVGKLSGVLEAGNIECDEVMAVSAPKNLDGLTQYKAVITVNCHYDDLPGGFAESLVTYVKDYAGGYICVGGDSSYALGSYRDTELEEILPVNVDPEGTNEILKMAMVMVIDHSGSMSTSDSEGKGLTGLTLAKQAAVNAVAELRDTDDVGVLEFDDKYSWVYPISGVSDRDAVDDAIRTIPYGGGTSIYPAISEAYEELADSDAAIKHIVLLTDGQDEFTSGYTELEDDINADGITLSAVAVGSEADTDTLKNLASACGGRYYYTDINNSIPRIFAQEVYLSTDEYLNNRKFYPQIVHTHELTEGVFDDGVPALYGYIATSAKSAADVVLASDEDEPVLATWQYGLGRTIAWCSDGSFGWTSGCARWEKYPQLWANMVNYVITDTGMGDDSVDIDKTEGGSRITLQTDDYDAGTVVSAVVTDESGNQTELALTAVKPGTYQGTVDVTAEGVYSVNVRKQEGGETVRSYNTAFAWQYSKEYTFASETGVLKTFADMAGGSMITMDDDVWELAGSLSDVRRSLTIPLLIAAIIILMADIALRRLGIEPCVRLRAGKKDAAGKTCKARERAVAARRKSRKVEGRTVTAAADTEAGESLDVSTLLKKKRDRR